MVLSEKILLRYKSTMKTLGYFILIFALAFLAATILGTIVWILWPSTIPSIFVKACASGYIPSHVSWWGMVKFSWIIQCLVGINLIKR